VSVEPKYLYLTTIGRRSGRPRRIEIWFTRHEGAYYLVAEHGRRSQWAQNLVVEPAVRARVGARSFDRTRRLLDSMLEVYQEWGGSKTSPTIAVVDWRGEKTALEQEYTARRFFVSPRWAGPAKD